MDTVGEVEVGVDETHSGGEDEVTEVTDLGNAGARPDFSRDKMVQKIQKFKKDHKKEYEEMTQEIIHHYEANIQVRQFVDLNSSSFVITLIVA